MRKINQRALGKVGILKTCIGLGNETLFPCTKLLETSFVDTWASK